MDNRIKLLILSFLIVIVNGMNFKLFGRIVPIGERAEFLDEPPEEGAELLDRISYVLHGDEEVVVLCENDLEKSTIDGKVLSPKEWVVSWATYLDAQRLKILADEDDVDKTLINVQRAHGLTEDDLRNMFKEGGYTWEEARKQLAMMQMERSRIDWEMASHSVGKITDDEIIAYCQAHPVYVQGKYTLQRAWISLNGEDRHAKKEELNTKIKKKDLRDIAWSPPYTLEEDELPDDSFFITTLLPDEICEPQDTPEGFELIKLVDKNPGHNKPFEQRRVECQDILKDMQYQKIIDDYQQDVIERTNIVAF